MFDVITIGSVKRDAFFEAPKFQTIPWKKTPSKKAIVLPLGEKLEVDNIYFTIGGNSANASVTFSRLGFDTACAGKTGDDPGGREIRRRLNGEGVDTNLITKTDELPTGYSVLLLKDGERTILGYHGASGVFDISDFYLKRLKAKWWYLSLSGESTRFLGKLIAFARKNKISVAFNPSGYHLEHYPKEILKNLKNISFLVLNEEEAAILTGLPFSKERQVFKKLDALMPGIVAVTNGAKGVTVSDGKLIYRAPAFKEKKLVDRTGAGDAFGSGFTAGLIKSGGDIKYAIRLASANATSVVEYIGATEGTLKMSDFWRPRWNNLKIRTEKV
ncbi:MAG: carbohydrate kinase family protein [Patescibacteria group bacterium]